VKGKILFLTSFLILCLVVTVPITAISYEKAQESTIMKVVYLQQLTRRYEPPKNTEVVYVEGENDIQENYDDALAVIRYKGFDSDNMKIEIYKAAFELQREDDLISTLMHEYNHARALSRNKIFESNKDYIDDVCDLEIKWRDLHDRTLYRSRILTGDNVSDHNFKGTIDALLKGNILELLAVKEEIWLFRKGKLSPSQEWKDSRYRAYLNYYFDMLLTLDLLKAERGLENKLAEIFYRDWFTEMGSYKLMKFTHGL